MTSKEKRNRRIHFCGIVIGIMLSSILLISGLLLSKRVNAEDPQELSLGEDNGEYGSVSTTWQDDYKYTLEDSVIYIKEYNKVSADSSKVFIPAQAVINSNTYRTIIQPTNTFIPNDNVTSFKVEEGVIIDSAADLFAGCTKLESVDLSKATGGDNFYSTSRMFYNCSSLSSVDFGELNLDTVTDMTNMFGNCSSLKEIDLSGINLESLTLQGETETLELHMFDGCTSLETLKLPTEFKDAVELYLPLKMYIKNDDGTVEEYEKVTKEQAGKTLVADSGKKIPSITAKDKSVTYDGNAIDITTLFEIEEGAGDAAYTLADTSTANIEGGKLTVTAADIYTITVVTGETTTMKSGTATANLTVNKAEGSGKITVNDVEFGSKPSPSATSSTNPGNPSFFYKLSSEGDDTYSSDVPTAPGDYMVKAVFSASDLYNECYAEATFAILKKTPSITATDKTVTYDGNAIDITALFEIGEGAGEASYTLEETDKAALEDGKLTVTAAGTYSITVVTQETTTMKSGTATANLTVNKAEGSGKITVNDVEFGSKPSPSATSSTNPGNPSFFYKLSSEGDDTYSSDVPTAPGDYMVKAVFPVSDLYNECYAEATFAILQKTPSITPTDKTVTYGGTAIDITSLFEIGEGAGEAVYTLADTATTKLEDGKLTVNSAGTYSITVVTKETTTMKSGTATANLTVNKAEGSGTVTVIDVVYGSIPSPVASSETNPGEVNYLYKMIGEADTEYTSEVPTEPGDYMVKAVFSASNLYNECYAEATFAITKKTLSIKATDKAFTYDGTAIDITSLFEIGEGAGEASYTLEETDKATLEDGKLTVTAAGTYSITVVTKETTTMKSGTATAKLTVNKAEGSGTVKVSDVVYGSIPSPAASSETNPGEVYYLYKLSSEENTSYSSEVPTEPGDYMVKAVFSASNLYNECYAEATFAIKKKERTNIAIKNKTVTYDGSAIDISDMFEIPGTAGTVRYEVTSDTAVLNGHLLSVTKADRYVISAYTEETNLYEAGIATADLIVKKAHGEGSVSISDVEFGSKPSPSATSSTNPGNPSFFYKLSSEGDDTYSSDIPTAPGKYTVKAVFPDTDLYEFSVTNEFTIKEDSGGNTLESTTWQNDWEFATNEEDHILILFSYAGTGDNIAINVPATATIDGVVYSTCIMPKTNLFNEEAKEKIVSFSVEDGVVINIARSLFDGLPNLKTVDLSNAVPGEAMDDMRWMFTGCSKLERVDLSGFDTGNVIDMSYMFRYCTKLKTITFGNSFKTDKVMYMTSMFEGCESLESLDLRSFEADELLQMPDMFRECQSLKTVQFGENFNTAKVTDMTFMFGNCSSIEELDLSNFSMAGMPENTESDNIVAIFLNNDKLQLLKLPSVFGYVDRFEFPTTMYVKEGDTIGSEGYSYATPFFAGKTMVAILSKERVKINKTNKTVTYDGNAIDISDMFEIPEYAGAVTYEVVSETAELNGHFLTVRKAGTYVIGVHTEETVLYEAGSAAADLIVRRAKGQGSISISDVEYGSKPSPFATSSTNPGDPVFHYKLSSEGDNTYSSNVPTAPGKYTVIAIFPDTDLYELSVTKEFTIKEGSSNGGSTDVNNGGNSSSGTSTDVNNGGSDTAAADNGNSGNGSSAETAKNINGLAVGEDNRWHLYKNGKILSDYNDLYCDEKLGWWKIKDGTVDFDYTGLYHSESCGWWLIGSGSVAFEYNDLWNDSAYGWWKIKDGAVDFGYTGLYYSESCGWRLIGGGSVAFEYNDLWNDSTYGWWKIKGGAVDFDYTGLYYSETYGWWLIEGGSVAFGYNGLWCDPVLGWWKVTEGKVDFDYTGLYHSETYGWWLINAGRVAFDYNGQWDDPVYGTVYGSCLIKEGKKL